MRIFFGDTGLILTITGFSTIGRVFIDFFLIGVSFVTACWTTCGTAGNLQIFLCTFGPLALLLCLSGTYRVLLAAGRNQRLLPAENAAASRFGPGLFAAVSARISEYGAAVQH